MKKSKILFLILSVLLIVACSMGGKPTPDADTNATLVYMGIQQTVAAAEQAALKATVDAFVNQPTATPLPTATATETPLPATPTPEATATPIPPTEVPTGSISGTLFYPSEYVPALRVIAFNKVTGYYYWINTVAGQRSYTISDLPPATYYVLAYMITDPSKDFYAAYSEYVTCGMDAHCTNHKLVEVPLKAGQNLTDINPADWYASDPQLLGWPLDPTIKWD
ncbi:MAG: hypothetical protein ACOYKD_07385 [Anaerolineaceae bacterium]|jgi:hypothetical protein